MPAISRADLARLVGVSPAAVTQAVKRKDLASEADGSIDTDLPLNAAWIARPRGKKPPRDTVSRGKLPPEEEAEFQRQAQARRAKAAARAELPASSGAEEDGEEEAEDDARKAILESAAEKHRLTRARRILAEESAARVALDIATKKGQLISLDIERRKWSAFDAALKAHVRDLPRRAAARLHAIAVAEGPAAFERAMEGEISQALARTLEAAKEAGLG